MMHARIRVLVVDDAVVVRRLVTDALSSDPELTIAGIAANGRIALQKIEQLTPDVVTLDVEMPEMDGLETIVEIRKRWPRLPVIMFSTLTERAASITLEALARGANDYVTKPSNVGSVMMAQQRVRESLIPKIKALCGAIVVRPSANETRAAAVAAASSALSMRRVPTTPRVEQQRVDVVAIGCSTGGPNALAALIPKLSALLPVPVVITQHMPPLFTRLLAERLNAHSGLRVAEAFEGAKVTPGSVWVAPGNHHMGFARSEGGVTVTLNQEPPEHSCRPSVDVMFRSAASVWEGRVLSVVLTGMGRDGTLGAEVIRRRGGAVLAQDEATSVVWGMPGYVTTSGLADEVLPLDAIAAAIERRVAAARGGAVRVRAVAAEALARETVA